MKQIPNILIFLGTNENNGEEENVEHTELLGFLFKLIVPQRVRYLKAFSIIRKLTRILSIIYCYFSQWSNALLFFDFFRKNPWLLLIKLSKCWHPWPVNVNWSTARGLWIVTPCFYPWGVHISSHKVIFKRGIFFNPLLKFSLNCNDDDFYNSQFKLLISIPQNNLLLVIPRFAFLHCMTSSGKRNNFS